MKPVCANTYFEGENFGEINRFNKLHGRGIEIKAWSYFHFGYFDNDKWAPGNFINIFRDGGFRVGEFYLKDG